MTVRVACIECGAVTPVRERGICRRCEPGLFAPAEWIGPIFAAMPDAPEHLRGELEEATSRDSAGRRLADYKREWRRRTGATCLDCGVGISRGATRCRSCSARLIGRYSRT